MLFLIETEKNKSLYSSELLLAVLSKNTLSGLSSSQMALYLKSISNKYTAYTPNPYYLNQKKKELPAKNRKIKRPTPVRTYTPDLVKPSNTFPNPSHYCYKCIII